MTTATKWLIVVVLLSFGLVLLLGTQIGCSAIQWNDEIDIDQSAILIRISLTNATQYTLDEITHAKTLADVKLLLTAISNAGIDVFNDVDPPATEHDTKILLIDSCFARFNHTGLIILTGEDEMRLKAELYRLPLKDIAFWLIDNIAVTYPEMARWRNLARDGIEILNAAIGPDVVYTDETRQLLLAFFTGIHNGCERAGE